MNDATLAYKRDRLKVIDRYMRSSDDPSIERYYAAEKERNKIRVDIALRYLEKRREKR